MFKARSVFIVINCVFDYSSQHLTVEIFLTILLDRKNSSWNITSKFDLGIFKLFDLETFNSFTKSLQNLTEACWTTQRSVTALWVRKWPNQSTYPGDPCLLMKLSACFTPVKGFTLLFLISWDVVKLCALNENRICTYFCLGSISPFCSVDGLLEAISFDKAPTSTKENLTKKKIVWPGPDACFGRCQWEAAGYGEE